MARIARTILLGALTMPLLAVSSPRLAAAAQVPGAQPPRQPNAAELGRALFGLSVLGRVLYVAAHPDDENTRLLAWLARGQRVETAYLSLTRGDGGQNLIGAEQGPLLGLIRTQELLQARRIDGARQFFTRARDFGYSKTPEETLAIWGKDAVLADVVWVIRSFKPDVIVTRFPPDGGETHGHHTASAKLALEAFRLAADASYHPEQLAHGVQPWQAKRIVWNRPSWDLQPGADLSGFLQLDVGGFDAAMGASYGEIAADSRSMHKSQGFGSARARGEAPELFKLLDGAPMKSGLFDGLELGWKRVPGALSLAAALERAQKAYRAEAPAESLPALLAAHALLARLPADPAGYTVEKERALTEAILGCAGLYAEATASKPETVARDPLAVTVELVQRAGAPLVLRQVEVLASAPGGARVPLAVDAVAATLARDRPLHREEWAKVPAEAEPSGPYWLAEPPGRGLYTVADPLLLGLPEQPPALTASFVLEAATPSGPERLWLERPVAHKWVDPVAGERWRAVEVLPAVTITPATPVLLFPDGSPRELKVTVRATATAQGQPEVHLDGHVELTLPPGFSAEPARAPFSLATVGAERELTFKLEPTGAPTAAASPASPASPGSTESARLGLTAVVGQQRFSRGLARIDHPHIPVQTLLPEAEVRLQRVQLQRGVSRVGYIPGAGDEVPEALRQAGYQVTLLSDEALRDQPLDRFEAIVVGVRAFNVNPRLVHVHAKLMDWVARGGTLLVQYNTANRLSKLPDELGPRPFTISQERVTDEDAAVVYDQKNPLFQKPNRLDSADWKGWVQERGLYFASKWDAAFEAPLAMHDAGEPARKGGLLIARHGKGTFIYTGLAFFRQLPAGVPGAFRLFANLLAHGRAH